MDKQSELESAVFKKQTQEIGSLLLRVGTLLLSCGANTERIRLTLSRFAEGFGYKSEILVTHHAIMLTLSHNERQVYSHLKRCEQYAVNFNILAEVSRLSWRINNDSLTIQQVNDELSRIVALPIYPRWLTILMVSVSGAAFCRLFGGDLISMLVTLVATVLGLLSLRLMHYKKFNYYLSVVVASFVSSLVASIFLQNYHGQVKEQSLAAVILFLVPGISLINAFTDFADGNLLNGFLRGMNGLIVAFCIALGWLTAIVVSGV